MQAISTSNDADSLSDDAMDQETRDDGRIRKVCTRTHTLTHTQANSHTHKQIHTHSKPTYTREPGAHFRSPNPFDLLINIQGTENNESHTHILTRTLPNQVRRFTKKTRDDFAKQLSDSRVEIWKTIGMLRQKLASYRRRIKAAKEEMFARDNYRK
jgi:hypothetical protein